MTREEAIKALKGLYDGSEAILMAIEALKHERTDEWCPGCKEYDTEKKCCPRFNRVIRGAMNREPSDDGTLEVKVEDATKVGRVLISDDKHRGGLYYPDEDEPQSVSFENDTEIKSCSKDSDLISRADAMMEARPEYLSPEQIGHEEYNKGWSDAISMYWANLNALPAKTQDRPTDGDLISRADAIEALGEEPPVWCDEEYEIAERNQWRADIEAIESVPSADRPRGEWIEIGENKDGTHNIRCNQCGESFKARGHANSHNTKKKYRFCPSCGADMRGEDE